MKRNFYSKILKYFVPRKVPLLNYSMIPRSSRRKTAMLQKQFLCRISQPQLFRKLSEERVREFHTSRVFFQNPFDDHEFLILRSNFSEMTYEEKKEFVSHFLDNNFDQKNLLMNEIFVFYNIEVNKVKLFDSKSKSESSKEFRKMVIYISLYGFDALKIMRIAFVAVLFTGVCLYMFKKRRKNWKSWSYFVEKFKNNEINHIIIHENYVEVVLKRGGEKRNEAPESFLISSGGKTFEKKLQLLKSETKNGTIPHIVYYDSARLVSNERFVITFLTISITVLGIFYLVRSASAPAMGASSGGIGDLFGKEIAPIAGEQIKTKLKDVKGLIQEKIEIKEFINFVKDFTKYKKIGAKIPNGCLLYGPPGCGKTLLARSVAGELDVPFFSMSGSDFVEMVVGIGPQRVRTLFKEARQNQPSIIFIDEIDAVASQRGAGQFLGRNDERENTLNQLLIEMDGFNPNENVVVIAATNRMQILDKALLRPGRFDRKIEIGVPTKEDRAEIFKFYLEELTIGMNIDEISSILAHLTPGFSGADISNICNEAALLATRDDMDVISLKYFEMAVEKIIGGIEKRTMLEEKEKKMIAYHEAGHALVGWLLEHADPILKVTIIPRSKGVLGFTQHLPKDSVFKTLKELEDHICMTLGGRAAEELVFHHFSTGASNDLQKCTHMSKEIILEYGMNDKIGNISFPVNHHILEIEKPYSEKIGNTVDKEVKILIDRQYKRCLNLLKAYENVLTRIADLLLERETISSKELKDVIGFEPKSKNEEFKEYLENIEKIK